MTAKRIPKEARTSSCTSENLFGDSARAEKACAPYLQLLKANSSSPIAQPENQDMFKLIMEFCAEPKSTSEIVQRFGFTNRMKLRRSYLNVMLADGRLLRTISERPSSKSQKYYAPHSS